MTRTRVLGVALLALAGVGVSAQPQFRTTTTYVTLDVVVTDKDDRPVTGLTRADFSIVERDRPQEIADFEHVSIPVGERTIDLEAPPAPPSDIASNSTSPQNSRAFVIVVDDTVLETADIIYIKRTIAALLAAMSESDHVALTYVRRSDLGQDFTNDTTRITAALNHLPATLGMLAASKLTPSRDLLVVLDNAAKTLVASKQSRKALVLIGTRGCNPRGRDIIAAICQGVIDRARESGVPIYAIDPTGALDLPWVEDPLRILTAATGGQLYRQAEPWLSGARAMTDNGSYYLLGYYPSPQRTDGKFQEVEVKVNRPGLQVRARRGYKAPWWREQALIPSRAMTAALGEGLPDPSLPIRAFVAPLATGGGKTTRTTVTVEVTYPVPPGGFSGEFRDDWRVGILALDPDGRTKASFQRPMTFTGTWKPSANGTFVLNETIDVPAQPLTFRIGVTSKALGKTGTAHIKVDVPDYRKSELQVSPLVLGLSSGGIDAAVGLDRLQPLVPFQPTTTRTFAAADSLRVFSRASWRDADGDVSFELRVVGSSLSVVTRGGATFDHTLSLGGLSPGAYVLRLTARLPSGDPALREVPFTVR